MKRTLVSIVMLGVAVGAPAFAQPQHRHLGSGEPSPDIINRNDPIHDPAARDTHYNPYDDYYATIEEFNARLAAGRAPWFWPTIAAALGCVDGFADRYYGIRASGGRNVVSTAS